MVDDVPHVVILGGGFGGIAAARGLKRAPVRITLVDSHNHHLFQPLLYQVATAALAATDIATPIRQIVRHQENCTVRMSHVLGIDPSARRVELDCGPLDYDHLIVATGMVNHYFGNDTWERHAPGMKTLEEALDIRSRVLRAYESAEQEEDPETRAALMTFVVVGAGATGVEMAGALAEIATRTLARDFRRLEPARDARVILVEGGGRVLAGYHEDSSRAARAALERIGVELRLNTKVTGIREGVVTFGDESVRAGTVVWAAGLRASPLTEDLGAPLDSAGRVKVEPDLRVPGHPEIRVIGDLIYLEQDGSPLPGVAQVALQSGDYVAKQLRAEIEGLVHDRPFRYKDKGSMATVGRAEAVAEVGNSRFSGFVAWVLWLFIHIVFLVDFRNRVAVLFEWAFAYLTWRRSARVILKSPVRKRRPNEDRRRNQSPADEGPVEAIAK